MSSIELGPDDLPDVGPDNHGRTTAGWVTTAGLVVATLLAALGIALPVAALTWAGVGVAVVALLAGGVLRALGYGQPLK